MSDTFKPADHGYEAITLELTLGKREVMSVSTFLTPEDFDQPEYLTRHLSKLFTQSIDALRVKGYITLGMEL